MTKYIQLIVTTILLSLLSVSCSSVDEINSIKPPEIEIYAGDLSILYDSETLAKGKNKSSTYSNTPNFVTIYEKGFYNGLSIDEEIQPITVVIPDNATNVIITEYLLDYDYIPVEQKQLDYTNEDNQLTFDTSLKNDSAFLYGYSIQYSDDNCTYRYYFTITLQIPDYSSNTYFFGTVSELNKNGFLLETVNDAYSDKIYINIQEDTVVDADLSVGNYVGVYVSNSIQESYPPVAQGLFIETPSQKDINEALAYEEKNIQLQGLSTLPDITASYGNSALPITKLLYTWNEVVYDNTNNFSNLKLTTLPKELIKANITFTEPNIKPDLLYVTMYTVDKNNTIVAEENIVPTWNGESYSFTPVIENTNNNYVFLINVIFNDNYGAYAFYVNFK